MTERPDWMYRQSAVVPYRAGADGLELLLITSRKGTRWVLPKGVVEPGMTQRVPLREVISSTSSPSAPSR